QISMPKHSTSPTRKRLPTRSLSRTPRTVSWRRVPPGRRPTSSTTSASTSVRACPAGAPSSWQWRSPSSPLPATARTDSTVPCPAVCRDEIKEGMVHAHGAEFQGGNGDPLTQRTLPLFFDVVRKLIESGVTVVAEAAFQDGRWRPGLEPFVELADLRIVRCRV